MFPLCISRGSQVVPNNRLAVAECSEKHRASNADVSRAPAISFVNLSITLAKPIGHQTESNFSLPLNSSQTTTYVVPPIPLPEGNLLPDAEHTTTSFRPTYMNVVAQMAVPRTLQLCHHQDHFKKEWLANLGVQLMTPMIDADELDEIWDSDSEYDSEYDSGYDSQESYPSGYGSECESRPDSPDPDELPSNDFLSHVRSIPPPPPLTREEDLLLEEEAQSIRDWTHPHYMDETRSMLDQYFEGWKSEGSETKIIPDEGKSDTAVEPPDTKEVPEEPFFPTVAAPAPTLEDFVSYKEGVVYDAPEESEDFSYQTYKDFFCKSSEPDFGPIAPGPSLQDLFPDKDLSSYSPTGVPFEAVTVTTVPVPQYLTQRSKDMAYKVFGAARKKLNSVPIAVNSYIPEQRVVETLLKGIVEHTVDLFVSFSYGTNRYPLYMAIYRLCKDLFPAALSATVTYLDSFGKFREMLLNPMFSLVAQGDEETDPVGHSMAASFIAKLKQTRDGVVDFTDCLFYKRLMCLISGILSCAAAVGLGVTDKIQLLLPKDIKIDPKVNLVDISMSMASSVVDVINCGYQYFVQGLPITSIHSGDTYAAWYAEVLQLESMSLQVGSSYGLPEAEFSIRVTSCYKRTLEMMELAQRAKIPQSQMTQMRIMSTTITQLYNKYVVYANSGTREQPFCVVLFGPPGCGKTDLTRKLFQQFEQVTNCHTPYSHETQYVVSPKAKFWDGFNQNKRYIVLDDIGSTKPVKGQIPEDISTFINLVNNVSFTPDQAAIEDKGMHDAIPHMVVATTNSELFGIQTTFNTPGAAVRRISLHIKVRVNPDYEKCVGIQPTGQIDDQKVKRASKLLGKEVTPWVLDVRIPLMSKGQECAGNMDASFRLQSLAVGSLEEVSHVIGTIMKEHKRSQTAYQEHMAAPAMEYCKNCAALKSVCRCTLIEQGTPEQPVFISPDVGTMIFTHGIVVGFFALMYVIVLRVQKHVLGVMHNTNNNLNAVTRHANESLKAVTASATNINLDVKELNKTVVTIGDRVEEHLLEMSGKTFRVVRALFLGVGIVQLFRFARSMMKDKESYHAEGAAFRKLAIPLKREDIYYQAGKPIIKNYSDATRSSTFEEVRAIVKRNVHQFRASVSDGKTMKVNEVIGFNIVGQDFVFPEHTIASLANKNHDLSLVCISDTLHTGANFVFRVDTRLRKVFHDLCVIRITSLPPVRNLTRFLFTDPSQGKFRFSGEILTPTVDHQVEGMFLDSELKYAGYPGPVRVPTHFQYNLSQQGLCGAPLIAKNEKGGFVILGFHIAGTKDSSHKFGCAHPFALSDFKSLTIDHFVKQGTSTQTYDVTSYVQDVKVSEGVHPKNSLNFYETPAVQIYGEVMMPHNRPKADVRDSLIKGDIEENWGETDCVQPIFDKGDYINSYGEAVYVNPMGEALEQITSANVNFPEDLLIQAIEEYSSRVIQLVPPKVLKALTPLTDAEAINGDPLRPFVRGIKRSAGGGFGMFTKKSNFLREAPTVQHPDGVTWVPEVWEHIRLLEDKYLLGSLGPVFQAHLKNEPRPLNLDTGLPKSARVFTGTPAAFSHLVRKYFLPIVDVMQTFGLAFECAVGVNACGADWGVLYKYITTFGKHRIVAGDFKKYDKKMPATLILASFSILIKLVEPVYSQEDIRRMWHIAFDSAFPTVLLEWVLYKFFGSLPSGHPLTVIINSICNSLLARIAYGKAGFDISTFSQTVAFLSYGDDNIFSTSVEFGHSLMSEKLAECGLTYTLADKSTASVDFQHIDSCDFLKRKFRPVRMEDGTLRVYAPLAEASLVRSMCLTFDSSLEERDQAVETIANCLREYVQYGEERHDQFRVIAEKINEKYSLCMDIRSFKSIAEDLEPAYEMAYMAVPVLK